jgi:hypothetical protein
MKPKTAEKSDSTHPKRLVGWMRESEQHANQWSSRYELRRA